MVGRRKKEQGPRQVHVAWLLHLHHPPGAGDAEGLVQLDEACDALIRTLEGQPTLRANLLLGGGLIELASRLRPALLTRIRGLLREDRIEILGGPWAEPVLSVVPAIDAVGQIHHLANQLQVEIGREPVGIWSPLRQWTEGLLDVLLDAGAAWTLLDDVMFQAAGLPPEEVHGHFVTEHLGRCLGLFPIDGPASLHAAAGALDSLAALLGDRAQPVDAPEVLQVVAVSGDGAPDPWLATLSWIAAESHWVKTWTLSRAREGMPCRGMIRPPSGQDPGIGDWLRVPRGTLRSPRLLGARSASRRTPARPCWETVFEKYPESNRLHKRMLRVSDRVEQLRKLLRDRQSLGQVTDQDRKARKVLERACEGLWRSQHHEGYGYLGKGDGIYDVRRRQRSHRELLGVERLIDKVLGDPAAGGWSQLIADLDGDGVVDALIRTASLSLLVSPARGGVLLELDLRERGLPLLTSLSAVEEPFHAGVSGTEIRLVDAEDDLATLERGITAAPVPSGLSVDGVLRGAFQDLFLAPETTLRSFARRQFRDLGDFSRGSWELLKTAPPGDDGFGEIQVGRSGVVRDVSQTQLLRLEKAFRLDTARARLWIQRSIENRSRDPASVWYGLEWTLGIPSGEASGVSLVVHGADGESRTIRPDGGAMDLGLVSGFEWEDRAADLAVVVNLEEPLTLWWAAVETTHPGPEGWVETLQGHTFLLHGPIQVWGNDTHRLRVAIEFLRASG